MKIKILTSLAGINFSYSVGQIAEVDDKTAIHWVKAGLAEPVDAKQFENAVIEPPENAALKAAKDKYPKHIGGGWYELPNGEKVKGKDEALEAMAKLEKGGNEEGGDVDAAGGERPDDKGNG